jgi:hypothetical protein
MKNLFKYASLFCLALAIFLPLKKSTYYTELTSPLGKVYHVNMDKWHMMSDPVLEKQMTVGRFVYTIEYLAKTNTDAHRFITLVLYFCVMTIFLLILRLFVKFN